MKRLPNFEKAFEFLNIGLALENIEQELPYQIGIVKAVKEGKTSLVIHELKEAGEDNPTLLAKIVGEDLAYKIINY